MAFKKKAAPASGGGGVGFQYRARTAEQMAKRAHQSGGGSRDGFIHKDFELFQPKDGDNKIRILPPTWDDAEHYGYEVHVHYQVGADNTAYACPQRMRSQPCPICEARKELDKAGDEDEAKALLPRKRVLMFVIDRDNEDKGPLLWSAPWTLDQDIAKAAFDDDGGVLALDHPGEGYDVSFSRDQQGKNVPPKYTGVKIARKPSPLFDDEEAIEKVLQFVTEHPVPSCVVEHDYETIATAFEGRSDSKKDKEDAKPSAKPAAKKPWGAPAAPAAPAAAPAKAFGKKKPEPEPEPEAGDEQELPSWEDVHAMSEEDLQLFAGEAGVSFPEEAEFDSLSEAADYVCGELGIEAPPPPAPSKPKFGAKKPSAAPAAPAPAPASGGGDWKARLSKLKK
jgi:hypothetical protein